MSPEKPPPEGPDGDDAIRAVVKRLARPHPKGKVIERAAILAEGPASAAIVAWIMSHAGEPETASAAVPRGLHGARGAGGGAPQRYVLPAGAL
jgi:hypothetical protein